MSRLAVFLLVIGCSEPAPLKTVLPPKPMVPVPVPAEEGGVATLSRLTGTVDLERDGGSSRAAVGPVYEADVVVTGHASTALLQDDAGHSLELGEDTRFKVGSRLAVVELLEGELKLSDTGDWGVRTPYGSAQVTPGSSGVFRVKDAGLTAEVLAGELVFFDVDAGRVDAKAGQRVVFLGGSVEFLDPVPPAPVAVASPKLVVELGKPIVKRPGQSRFVPAQKTELLETGAAVTVPAGASARLEVPHATIRLAAGTSGISQGVRDDSGQSTLALEKVVGSLTVLSDGQRSTGLEVNGTQVHSSGESTVVVVPGGKKTRIDVRAGEAVVMVKGVPTTVRSGEAVLVDGVKATATTTPKPGLVVSGGGRVRVHGDIKEVAVALPDERNRVQLSRDSDFAMPFVQGAVGKQLTVPGGRPGPVFYRVLDPAGQPTKSGRVDFLADTASSRDTATRTDTVAETGQKATVFYQSRVPALTFAITAQPDVKAWQFQLSRASDLQHPVVARKLTEPKLVLEPGVLTEGEFLWVATPLDANGAPKSGGRMNKLSVVYDNARTSLLIEHPVSGERASPSTKAVGVAPRSAQLFINGKAVKVDESGRFSVPVGAVDAVVFRVVSPDQEGFWVRKLRR